MGCMEKNYRSIYERSWVNGEEQTDYVKQVIQMSREPSRPPNDRYHLIDDCEWYKEKYGFCYHCRNGSIPKTKEEINEIRRKQRII